MAVVDELLGRQGAADDARRSRRSSSASGAADDLPAIVDRFVELAAAEREHEVAEVRTAVPLDDAPAASGSPRRCRQATGKQVEVKVVVDESVLGGIVATIGDTVIDGTVRHRLDQLKETDLMHGTELERYMAELTINADEIAAVLRKHVEDVHAVDVEASRSAACSRSATASRASPACPTPRSTSCSSSRAARSASR